MKGEKPKDIRERTLQYAVQAIRLYQRLQEGRDSAGWVIGKQFLRSVTSIGANIEEAQSGESRADFVHKYSIAQKEARETLYWLKLMREAQLLQKELLDDSINETDELIAIITTIILNTKRNAK